MARLMPNAKGTAEIAPEIADYRKPGLWGSFWPFWPKQPFLVILASHFRARADTPKKVNLGVLLASCINETELHFYLIQYKLNPPEARQIFILAGVFFHVQPKAVV